METAKVYFTDFRTQAFGDGLPTKLKKLVRRAGIADLDLEGKFVAIKLHFGELGNVSYLRPNYARALVDVVKELGGKPFLTDCNTMYPAAARTPSSTWNAHGRTASRRSRRAAPSSSATA
ncbi:DUF362 domain-containing protein [Gordonibacter pamelaeae]|uniref:DUF362 domain-containing protein n=1 Tax=Gordonibacter pamelaeae 7-10-1-b TaxID=657308 RepID=D6E986_9ACTN|nr:DUF362 domain-containing protein [Gordonibacter pamelaeae]CBL04283.1 hypothetical protein GPA_18600 [Gordonibacter pamelaeae 7-10-1-b]